MTKCSECGGTVVEARRAAPYQYIESGLTNVYIDAITVYQCQSCHAKFPEIPAMDGLHDSIARFLMKKPFALTGLEFRFLRKQMRMKAKDLAVLLGVTPTTVSRWENGAERIGVANDRLIRSLYMHWQVKQGKIIDPRTVLEQIQNQFGLIKPRTKKVAIHLPASTCGSVPPELVHA